MELTLREANELAAFFARRFPGRAQVDDLARLAGVHFEDTLAGDHIAAWSSLIVGAQSQHRLRRLARAAALVDGSDDNLQEVCTLLSRGEGPSRGLIYGGVAALVAVVAFGVGAWAGLGSSDTQSDVGVAATTATATATAAETPALASPPLASSVVSSVAVELAATELAAGTGAETGAVQTAAAAADPGTPPSPAPVVHQASILPVRANGPRVSGRCGGPEGQIVGYWYAGRQSPGVLGDTITVPRATNVRIDYPDKHNDYNARAPLSCGLKAGDRIHLSQAPIQVPGDAWWVPIAAGDLS